MKLDKKRAYGVISGEHGGAVFEQDGKLFDGEENEVVIGEPNTGEVVSTATVAAPKATAKAKAAAAPKAKAAAPEAPAGEVKEQTALDEQLSQQGA